jgi:hypothetical protein
MGENDQPPSFSKMPVDKKTRELYIIIAAVVALGILSAVYFMATNRAIQPHLEQNGAVPVPEQPTGPEQSEESFGGEVISIIEEPVQKAAEVPTANPLGSTEYNPYSGYQNPFNR